MELSSATLLKLGSFIAWSCLYLHTSVNNPGKNPEWCSRAVTLLHGIVATIVGMAQCSPWTLTMCEFSKPILARNYALMVWSWGYFAFDLLWCFIYWSDNALMLLHHVSALGAISIYMRKDCTGRIFPCSLAIMEVTNPLLQLRWFLRHEGYDKTVLFKVIEVTYLVLFLAIRAIIGTYLIIRIVGSDMFDMEAKTVSMLLYLVSLGLIYEIVSFVAYKYRTKIDEFTEFLEEMGLILNIEM